MDAAACCTRISPDPLAAHSHAEVCKRKSMSRSRNASAHLRSEQYLYTSARAVPRSTVVNVYWTIGVCIKIPVP
jgi:hypothetical protein